MGHCFSWFIQVKNAFQLTLLEVQGAAPSPGGDETMQDKWKTRSVSARISLFKVTRIQSGASTVA